MSVLFGLSSCSEIRTKDQRNSEGKVELGSKDSSSWWVEESLQAVI